MNAMAPTNAGQSSNSLASSSSSSSSSMGSSMASLSSRLSLSSVPSRSRMAINKASSSMSNNVANECSSLHFNGVASAWDTLARKRADVGYNSSRGARTLDAFENQKALLAACGVDPSGMTRPPPRDQRSMMRMPPKEMIMSPKHQPGMMMMDQQPMKSRRIRSDMTRHPPRDQGAATSSILDQRSMVRMGKEQMRRRVGKEERQQGLTMMSQQTMESQRIRSLLNFGARRQLAKMMAVPNLGASNSNLMAVMIHQQQQQQQMSPSLEDTYNYSKSFRPRA